jgi:hypothetical protein
MRTIVLFLSAGMMGSGAAVFAQAPASTAEQTQSRYQIGQMERVLEGAVEHGAKVWRDRFQAVMPTDMLLTENAKARGFRLEGYGVVFDVEVPSVQSAPLWSFRTMDQNDLGLASALDVLRSVVEKTGDSNVQQALKRVELQVVPASPTAFPQSGSIPGISPLLTGAVAVGGAAPVAAGAGAAASLGDPQIAFRSEIKNALMDAMLDHSRGLDVAAGEWLVIAARSSDDRPSLAPADNDARTAIIRVSGADLTAFLGGQIPREEAKNRMNVRDF